MIQRIPTRCIYFSVAYHLRILWLKVLDLKQLWDGWSSGKFPRKRVSKAKTCWKVLYWSVETVIDLESSQGWLSRSRKRLSTKGSDQQVCWVKCHHVKDHLDIIITIYTYFSEPWIHEPPYIVSSLGNVPLIITREFKALMVVI